MIGIFKKMLSLRRCNLWEDAIFEKMQSLRRCYLWEDAIFEKMLSLRRCYLWEDAIFEKMLPIQPSWHTLCYRGTNEGLITSWRVKFWLVCL